MKQPATIKPHRLERFAWMVALVVVLRVLAWDLHHVLEFHQAVEHCEICLVAERGGDGILAAAGKAPPPPPSCTATAEMPEPHEATPAPCPLPRGPPVFLS